MCSIAIGGLVAGAAGQAFKVAGDFQQSRSQASMYKYQANVNDQQTRLHEQQQRDQAQRQLAQQRLGAGARGVEVGGSALDSLADQRGNAEWNILADRYNGNLQSTQLRWQAKATKRAGNLGLLTGSLGVGSSLLTGIDNRWPAEEKPSSGPKTR